MTMVTMNELRKNKTTDYIGDGVYVFYSCGCLWLNASNGESVQDSIALEPEVLRKLLEYADRIGFTYKPTQGG